LAGKKYMTEKQCPLCRSIKPITVYSVNSLPIFQNVVFDTEEEALLAKTADIRLVECEHCGFIWNVLFDESLMNYGKNYQNEQGISKIFEEHLNEVIRLFIKRGYKEKKIVEVGCGKGLFLNKLNLMEFKYIKGYDPAYEGYAENIVAEYFRKNSKTKQADLVVLRHVLEHIADPVNFLHLIAEVNNYQGDIYIEVPDFYWIQRKSAFWDIYNEHCNYFSSDSIGRLFSQSESHLLFNEQYIGIFASLSSLKEKAETGNISVTYNTEEFNLNHKLETYRKILLSNQHKKIVLWGAASKGVIFVNLLDKDKTYIQYLVDINPKKQGKFIGGTGHYISAPPPNLPSQTLIIVANENYLCEIQETAPHCEYMIL
jgi:Zn ribbon nucleic-acid-binding protein